MPGTRETLAEQETVLADDVKGALDTAIDNNLPQRIWADDAALWSNDPAVQAAIKDRLGWLDVSDLTLKNLKEITEFADSVKKDGFTHVAVLGMGGSSLCVEVLRDTFGSKEGYPELLVLDSTHPDQILALERACDLDKTLFIVSSKSGTTLEPNCYFEYFWNRLVNITSRPRQFAAITDPGTPLAKRGADDGFRKVFENPADIGGRYSVLSFFGMVPAALAGIDIEQLLSRASSEAGLSRSPEERNPPLAFGMFMGTNTLQGRDKLTIVCPQELQSFGYWAEQLIAESTGKLGKGILPIEGESETARKEEEQHRMYAHLTLGDETLSDTYRNKPNHIELHLMEPVEIGAEFFRWEFATAVAGKLIGINPFDEPNVAESKAKTNEVLKGYETAKNLVSGPGFGTKSENILNDLYSFLSLNVKKDGYIAIMAYLNRDQNSIDALQKFRDQLSLRYHVPVTVGFGPRFLHSTGQLHKGGPATGTFIQFVDEPKEDIAIPEKSYTFGTLIRAQAIGDYETLLKHERPVVSFDLGKDPIQALSISLA